MPPRLPSPLVLAGFNLENMTARLISVNPGIIRKFQIFSYLRPSHLHYKQLVFIRIYGKQIVI